MSVYVCVSGVWCGWYHVDLNFIKPYFDKPIKDSVEPRVATHHFFLFALGILHQTPN